MKRYELIIIIFFTFGFTCFAAPPNSVKGGYTSCKEYSYIYNNGTIDTSSKTLHSFWKYNSFGKITNQQDFESIHIFTSKDTDEKSVFSRRYVYNALGLVIAQYDYAFSDTVEFTAITKYNEKGQIIEGNGLKPDGKVLWSYFVKYDHYGNVIEEKTFDQENQLETLEIKKYNDRNKLIMTAYENFLEPLFYKEKLIYDNRGLLIEIIMTNYKNDSLQHKTNYKYNDLGQKVESFPYDDKGIKIGNTTYSYDKYGNTIQMISYDYWNCLWKKETCKFDIYGNCTEKTDYNNKNMPIQKYEYIYSK